MELWASLQLAASLKLLQSSELGPRGPTSSSSELAQHLCLSNSHHQELLFLTRDAKTYTSGAECKAVPRTSKSTSIGNCTFEESGILDISNDFRIAVFKKITASTTGNKEGKDLKAKLSNREYITAWDSSDKTQTTKTATWKNISPGHDSE